jgi:hypothetical protein
MWGTMNDWLKAVPFVRIRPPRAITAENPVFKFWRLISLKLLQSNCPDDSVESV